MNGMSGGKVKIDVIERHRLRDSSDQPWCTYALHLATPLHSIITDPLLVYFLYMSTERRWSFVILANWMVLVKLTKLLPLFRAHPSDICFIPFAIGFGYFHGFIKYYALLTLKNVGTFPSLTTPKLTASRLPGAAVTRPTQMLEDAARAAGFKIYDRIEF
jgi:hypothetical protein